jgi:hypothetical protein
MAVKFRREPLQLSSNESEIVDRVIKLAEELYDSIDMAPPSAAREHAVVRLQECVMWAIKAIGEHR